MGSKCFGYNLMVEANYVTLGFVDNWHFRRITETGIITRFSLVTRRGNENCYSLFAVIRIISGL